jgi:DNA-directed RNA polymerase subunit N (RpoN/RPB10)
MRPINLGNEVRALLARLGVDPQCTMRFELTRDKCTVETVMRDRTGKPCFSGGKPVTETWSFPITLGGAK